jgi:UDP-N-acetylmuramoyl-L-alanyl-D-glutamate--2,6-diaminopimelate ligase
MRFSELTKDIEGCRITGEANVPVSDIVYNTSLVGKGSCFVALRGSSVDGHDYIADAVSRGAAAVVSERPVEAALSVTNAVVDNSRSAMAEMACQLYGNPTSSMKMVGITGTNGKTTITYILESIFKKAGLKPGVIGTISYRYGGLEFMATHTTPESVDLQKLLREMLDTGVDSCAMEVSSHALSQDRATGCSFDCAVFTNLTPEHLDYHDDMDDYFEAKAVLFERYLAESKKSGAFAVINSDDPYGRKLVERSSVPVTTYGLDKSADVRGIKIETAGGGLKLRVAIENTTMDLESELCGSFNALNILAAVAVAHGLGIDSSVIIAAIAELRSVPGRFEKIENKMGLLALVDYAHTPDALDNVLTHARELINGSGGRLITVFGCGGDRDRTKRPVMGGVVGRLADVAIVTSDNPRTEDPTSIIDEIVPGLSEFTSEFDGERGFEIVADRRAAIERAVNISRAGDVVIVAGKGHEDYQIIGTEKRDFDDRKVLKIFLDA